MSELIGLLPAAGRGSRLGPIPSSKEVMPLGFELCYPEEDRHAGWRPFTTIESHLHAYRKAGVERVVIVLGSKKTDIMEYLGSGSRYGLHIAYLFQEELRGMPFALDLARPFTHECTTVFSMPDTLIEPHDSIARLSHAHRQVGADLSLGLFETDNPSKFGMVELDNEGRIVRFADKPSATDLRLMWGLAVWSPAFTRFMGDHLADVAKGSPETVLSDILEKALHAGMTVHGVELKGAIYNDIGTPEEFQSVVRKLALRAADSAAESSAAK